MKCLSMLNKLYFANGIGICEQKGGPMESSYQWEIWGRRGVVFTRGGGVWCWILESHKKGLGSHE